ncbi:MAG: hypothetical protein RBQ88_11310 [Desulfobulbus oligotrophicus]|jgi:hypothetical protein|nr:hypothetical protein [Desulfobulbus oligotrophicus]
MTGNTHPTFSAETIKTVIGCITTCIGLVVILIGLKYAIDIFGFIFVILKSPLTLTEPVQQLAESFGGTAFDIQLSDRVVPVARMIALIIYCCGVLVCALLTMALMQTGAKIVSLSTTDRHAIKQALQSVFGSRSKLIKTDRNNSPVQQNERR